MAGSDAVNSLGGKGQGTSRGANRKTVTYTEGLQVVHRDSEAIEVEESILKHAAMPVAVKEQRLATQPLCSPFM
jgi:hypothetical protein